MNIRLRSDLDRVLLGEFALPLGIDPLDRRAPTEGYTLAYNTGEDDDPDTYTFHVVVSHEKLQPLLKLAFQLLPDQVWPIVEIDSYDAYRTVDVFIGREDSPVSVDSFRTDWVEFENVLIEEGAVGAGANSDDPFIEVFIDQWKALSIHVPLDVRETVENMLQKYGVREVPQTWPDADAGRAYDATIRPVLDEDADDVVSLDEVIVEIRRRWNLELNVDPDRNLDDGGHELGVTLWHAGVVVHDADTKRAHSAYMSVWASARSLTELEQLIEHALDKYPEWAFFECYSVTRVAFDDRPTSLDDIAPRRTEPAVHLVDIHPGEENRRRA